MQNLKYDFIKIMTPLSASQEVLLSWSIDSAKNLCSNYVQAIFADFLHYKQTIYVVLYEHTIKIDGKWIALFEHLKIGVRDFMKLHYLYFYRENSSSILIYSCLLLKISAEKLRSLLGARTADARWGNRLHCKPKNQLAIPHF